MRPTLLKPLPRVRAERFAWVPIDTAWLVAAAAACCALAARQHPSHLRLAIGLILSIASASGAYVAGLKLHSRVAAVAAAVLVASSPNYVALCVEHPVSGAVAAATILAVASYGVGWMLMTYCAACLSFVLGFNGALVGLVIAGIPAVQRREHAAAGMIGYAAFGVLWCFATRSVHLPHGMRSLSSWAQAAPFGGLAAFVAWFFVPFYAEATLRGARDRWLLGLALVAVLVLILFTSKSAIGPQIYDAFPIAMLVVAVGLARLMPLISGDYPTLRKRYFWAFAAVAATLMLKSALEPPTLEARDSRQLSRISAPIRVRQQRIGFLGRQKGRMHLKIGNNTAISGNKVALDKFSPAGFRGCSTG